MGQVTSAGLQLRGESATLTKMTGVRWVLPGSLNAAVGNQGDTLVWRVNPAFAADSRLILAPH